MKIKRIGIVIPAHNEEKRIRKTLEEYNSYFKKKNKIDKIKYTILVVINNTKDKTEQIVREFTKKTNIVSYVNLKLGGKGYAVTEGFKYFIEKKYDIVGFVDADLSTSPHSFYDLIYNIGDYSAIVGNRWSSKSLISKKQTLIRRFASRVFNNLVKFLFFMKYQDTQCGAKVFKTNDLKNIVAEIFITQWAFDVNLLYLYKKNKLKVLEFPTVWNDRDFSNIDTIRASIKMFCGILRLRLVYSPFKFILRAYDDLPEILKLNHSLIK